MAITVPDIWTVPNTMSSTSTMPPDEFAGVSFEAYALNEGLERSDQLRMLAVDEGLAKVKDWSGTKTINFGQHKGLQWKDPAVDYLSWLVRKGPVSYVENATAELRRRGEDTVLIHSINAIKARKPIPVGTDTSGTVGGATYNLPKIEGEETEEERLERGIEELLGEQKIPRIRKQALNDASLIMWKNFVLRAKKELGIYDWLEEYVKEAIAYREAERKEGTKVIITYTGMDFEFDLDPRVNATATLLALSRIRKTPDVQVPQPTL